MLTAPTINHKEISVVERSIKTEKRRLACIKEAAKSQFNVKRPKNIKIYHISIFKQKTLNLSLFGAHFERRPITPLGNISQEPSLKKVFYEKDNDKDQDTVKLTQFIHEDKWNDPDRSDTEIEQNKTNAIRNAQDGQLSNPQGESRAVNIDVQCKPTPKT